MPPPPGPGLGGRSPELGKNRLRVDPARERGVMGVVLGEGVDGFWMTRMSKGLDGGLWSGLRLRSGWDDADFRGWGRCWEWWEGDGGGW